jgi:hypothetical protein
MCHSLLAFLGPHVDQKKCAMCHLYGLCGICIVTWHPGGKHSWHPSGRSVQVHVAGDVGRC